MKEYEESSASMMLGDYFNIDKLDGWSVLALYSIAQIAKTYEPESYDYAMSYCNKKVNLMDDCPIKKSLEKLLECENVSIESIAKAVSQE
jgi:hypothetical protein